MNMAEIRVKKSDVKVKQDKPTIVDRIKAAGQDLIDRAESFVSDDMDCITDLNIYIRMPSHNMTTIEVCTETISKNEMKLFNK